MANRIFATEPVKFKRQQELLSECVCSRAYSVKQAAPTTHDYYVARMIMGHAAGKSWHVAGTVVTPEEAAAKIEQNLRVAELERRVATLERDNRDLRSEMQRIHARPARQQAEPDDPRLSDVVALTEEMFGTPEINVMCDPEDPDTSFVVFTVRCRGEARDIVARRIEWHDRVDAIPPGRSGRFRLSIVPLR